MTRRTYTVTLRHKLMGTYRDADVYARDVTDASMGVITRPHEEVVSITAKAAPRPIAAAVREFR